MEMHLLLFPDFSLEKKTLICVSAKVSEEIYISKTLTVSWLTKH